MKYKNKKEESKDSEIYLPQTKGLHAKKPLKVPKLTDDQLEALQSADAEIRASGLVTLFDMALPVLPPQYQFALRDRKFVENAFNACFDLIGGVPRLALWAHQNPGEFYKLYGKMMPEAEKANQALNTQINITNHIPRSPLDDVTLTAAHIVPGQEDDEL